VSSQLFDPGPGTFDYNIWTTADSLTRESMFSLAERHSGEPYFALQVLLRYCETSPIEVVDRYKGHFRGTTVQRSERQDGAGTIRLVAPAGGASTSLACVPADLPNIWILGTTAKTGSAEHERLVSPILERLASRIKAGWVSSHELERSLLSFQKATGASVSPSRVASRGFDRSTIEYLRAASLEQVISELRGNKLLMHSLAFKLRRGTPPRVVLSGSVNRALRAVYRGGNSRLFDRHLIGELQQLLASHFGYVAIRDNDWGKRRILFEFEEDALKSGDDHGRLVDALARASDLAVCAFHLNPYLNLSVADLTDGSSMTLISDVADKMYVMPGTRCSSGAVSRVLDVVYAGFAAGRVLRTEPQEGDWRAACGATR